ncbi:uncharacterized protein HKW66_Vig0202010 [Vigna angularis]|uniref:non-specific serine/threonine protein kinase n=1 Tax=Phaseolus angularis TaxID=3914 RepID=A0A8T0JRF8_PHAAN|nr:uncharacterized protein HKW66_Vig0202010 [Vigna angularis]
MDEAVLGSSGSASKAEDDSVNEDEGWVLPIEKVTSFYWEMGEKEGAGKWGPRMAASNEDFLSFFSICYAGFIWQKKLGHMVVQDLGCGEETEVEWGWCGQRLHFRIIPVIFIFTNNLTSKRPDAVDVRHRLHAIDSISSTPLMPSPPDIRSTVASSSPTHRERKTLWHFLLHVYTGVSRRGVSQCNKNVTADFNGFLDRAFRVECLCSGDIKPGNLLLERYGYLKLSDFLLCKPLDRNTLEEKDFSVGQNVNGTPQNEEWTTPKRSRQEQLQHCPGVSQWNLHQAYSTVSTPDYIAPKVLLKKGYGMECDW